MTDGPALMEALQGVQQLYAQVALLLRTADEHLVGEARLAGMGWSRATGEGSASMNDPAGWLPSYVARFFYTEDPHVIAFVSVCLVDRPGDRFVRPFTEPLVSAGWVRFEAPAPRPWRAFWWAKMPHWTDHPRDGTMSRSTGLAGQPDANGAVEQRCLALPLVEISTTQQLIRRVLEPMVATLPDPP